MIGRGTWKTESSKESRTHTADSFWTTALFEKVNDEGDEYSGRKGARKKSAVNVQRRGMGGGTKGKETNSA